MKLIEISTRIALYPELDNGDEWNPLDRERQDIENMIGLTVEYVENRNAIVFTANTVLEAYAELPDIIKAVQEVVGMRWA